MNSAAVTPLARALALDHNGASAVDDGIGADGVDICAVGAHALEGGADILRKEVGELCLLLHARVPSVRRGQAGGIVGDMVFLEATVAEAVVVAVEVCAESLGGSRDGAGATTL